MASLSGNPNSPFETMPLVSISAGAVTASSSGPTDAIVDVNVSAPSQQTLSVFYATTDGTARAGSDYVKSAKPRILFVGYGETDNWAHQGRYDLVLDSAHRMDYFVHQLWDTMQAMPEYRDQTTFIITTDHGRGSGLVEWKEHGALQKGSENIWIGVIGPDTAPLGERRGPPAVKQAQIAATIAALLGSDYRSAEPRAAPPLPVVGKN